MSLDTIRRSPIRFRARALIIGVRDPEMNDREPSIRAACTSLPKDHDSRLPELQFLLDKTWIKRTCSSHVACLFQPRAQDKLPFDTSPYAPSQQSDVST